MRGSPDALLQQAFALHRAGRVSEARRLYGEVLRAAPKSFDALHLAGVAAYQQGDAAEGVRLIAAAIARNGAVADAHSNLGNALRALKRHDEALASYERALALGPNNAVAHNNRGIVLHDLGRRDDALEAFDRALALKPDYAEARNNRGNVLNLMGRHEEALAEFDRALALNPAYAEAWYNRAIALNDLERFDQAVAADDRALALRPAYAAAHYNRAIALQALSRPEEALRSYAQARALEPQSAEIAWNMALCTLLTGRFAEGWALYEWRKQQAIPIGLRDCTGPEWTGAEDIAGRTIFVYAEQGLGDTIQFCRYLVLLEAKGARVIFAAQAPLEKLIATLSPTIAIIGPDDAPPAYDFHIALMSLPRAFATALATIPAPIPYLATAPARVEKWRRIVGDAGLRIGIAWQGKPGPIDRGRSFPLRHFENLSQREGLRLISLQKHDGVEQLATMPESMRVETYEEAFDSGADAFLDTAALIATLDLVIAPDTAVAHLAGALGKPVWLALAHVSEWRWLQGRDDSPWYPTARLFRQPARGDWDGTFVAMEGALVEGGAIAPACPTAL